MYGPNQVGELIVGNAVAAETTVPTFVASASDKEIKLLSVDGSAPTAGKPFYFLQKTAGDATKNLNYEFSDRIDPRYIDKITVAEYAPEVLKSVKVDGFTGVGVIAAQRTYTVEIRLEDQLSPENFQMISGYYVTGEVLGSDTATTVRNGLITSLNKNLARRGGSEFTVAADGTGILITEKYQENVPGKIEGRKFNFTVTPKVFNNIATGFNSNLGLLTVTTITEPFVGQGTGKFATNFEWFVKGYKYDADRLVGYPADFGDRTPYYTSKDALYNVIQVKYFAPRNETSVERQYKVLTILVEKEADDLASNAPTNEVLADIRTAVGSFLVVVDDLDEA
jgi:hypothetical protein